MRDAQPFFGAVEDAGVEIVQLLPDVDPLGMESGDRLELGGTAHRILELVAADLGDPLSERCAFGLRQARDASDEELVQPSPLARRLTQRFEACPRQHGGRRVGHALHDRLVDVAGGLGLTEHFFEDLGALELEGRARHRGRLPRGAPVEQLAKAGGVVARPQRPFEQLEHLVVAGLPLVKGAEDRGGRITVAERIEQQASAVQVEASRLGAAVAHASSLAFEQGHELGVAAGQLEQSGEGLGCVGGWRRQVEDLPAHGDGGLEIADRVFEHGREAGEGLRADRFGNSLAPRAQAAGLIRGAPEALIGAGQRLQCLESIGLTRQRRFECLDGCSRVAQLEQQVGPSMQALASFAPGEQGREPTEGIDLLGVKSEARFEPGADFECGARIRCPLARPNGPGMGRRELVPARQDRDRALGDGRELEAVVTARGLALAHREYEIRIARALGHAPKSDECRPVPLVGAEGALEADPRAADVVELVQQELAELAA